MKMQNLKKRISALLLASAILVSVLPTAAFAAEVPSKDIPTADYFEVKDQQAVTFAYNYNINGKYQLTFRGYFDGKFRDFFTFAIPCGYKTITADYVWAKDPQRPYGDSYGWLLRVNGRVCSTIYSTSYGFPQGIPEIGVTGSQYTGNLSFVNGYDMSKVRWSYQIPNTGNGNVITNMLGGANAINVSVPVRYVDRATGAIVANDNHIVTSYGTSTAFSKPAKVPAGYVLDPASQSQVVNYEPSGATPGQIIFYVKPEAIVSVIKVNYKIDKIYAGGEIVVTDVVVDYVTVNGVGYHVITPDTTKVPAGAVLKVGSAGAYLTSVDASGVAAPGEFTFEYDIVY